MQAISGWDWILICGAGYFAVSALVKLMRSQHQSLSATLRRDIKAEKKRREEARKKADGDDSDHEAA